MSHHPFSIHALFSAIKTRPRLLTSILVGLLSIAAIPQTWNWSIVTQWTMGWNMGALLYLALALHMMFGSTHERMCNRAVREDDGRLVLLALVVFSAITCLGAIVAELAIAKTMQGPNRYEHIALAALTIVTSWTFTQVMFALHYAHDYYLAESFNKTGGLHFPGDHAPDYGDFLYAACVIGTSGQPADVSFTSRTQRRVGMVHSVLSFFFNTMIIAMTINIASGLF
jgi:uncharacterized membrane protein